MTNTILERLRDLSGVDRHSSKNWCGVWATRGALKMGRCFEIHAHLPRGKGGEDGALKTGRCSEIHAQSSPVERGGDGACILEHLPVFRAPHVADAPHQFFDE